MAWRGEDYGKVEGDCNLNCAKAYKKNSFLESEYCENVVRI